MAFAIFVAVFVAVFVAIFLALVLSGKGWRVAQEKDRARRLAEHRISARLLRLEL